MSDMTTIETCKQCQTTYRLSLAFPHVCPQQPTPEGDGEWVYNYSGEHAARHGGWHIRIRNDNGDCLAHTLNEKIAAQIVTDHARAALVPMLLNVLHDAMKVVADKAAGGRMLTTQNEARDVWQKYADVLAAASREG